MKEDTKKTGPGERRRAAIMEAALRLFMNKGYAAVSIDEIVRAAGGSKSTVYELFGSKEGLFLKIVSSVNEQIMGDIEMPDIRGLKPKAALARIGAAVAEKVLSEKCIELYRLAVSESRRFPKIGRLFYEAGPGRTQKGLAEHLAKEAAAGRLTVKDPERAARYFLGVLLMRDHMAMSVGCAKVPSKAEIERLAADAAELFLSGCCG